MALDPRVPELLLPEKEVLTILDNLLKGLTDNDIDRLIPPKELVAVVWQFMEVHASSVISFIFNQQPQSVEHAIQLFEEVLHDPSRNLKDGIIRTMQEYMWKGGSRENQNLH